MPSAADLAQAGDKYLGTPYAKMDCQAFVERCLRDVGISYDLPGSNAWYRAMDWVGSPEECRKKFGKIPVGAFLFILEDNGGEPEKYKADGIGNASHIGIYTGRGDGAIHSSSSRGCVAYSKFAGKTIPNGGWNRVGLWHRLFYNVLSVDVYMDNDDPPDGSAAEEGGEIMGTEMVVLADSGSSVKLRAKPSTTCATYWDVPLGETVQVLETSGSWSRCEYDGHTGYMMTSFLAPVATDPDGGGQDPEDEQIMIPKNKLLQIYEQLGLLLGRLD